MPRPLDFHPLLTASNGVGGYHLRILFTRPVPTPQLFGFLQALVRDYRTVDLPVVPETFPKQSGPVKY
jgi:hypothetical protein